MMINGSLPIPGENFTSDTKNYPWHQPPEFTSLKAALDKMSVKMTEKKTASMLMTMVEMGFPLVRISQMIIMEGVAQGKWTVDLALLLAGPMTKILEIMADYYGLEYDIGIEDKENLPTGTFLKGITDLDSSAKKSGVQVIVKQEAPKIEAAAEGQEAAPVEGGEQEAPTEDLGTSGFATMMGGAPKEEEQQ